LIEYVDRVIQRVKNVGEKDMRENWANCMDKFSNHYVWHSKDKEFSQKPRLEQMQGRLKEMQDRRRRLIKYLYKREERLGEFESGYSEQIEKKSGIVEKFSGAQLEELLRTSTKNVAQEVVQTLIPPGSENGLLVLLERA